MAYTSNSHVSGAAITALHAENWETQYTCVRRDFIEKFSTASTGTKVFHLAFPSSGMNFAGGVEYALGNLYVPTNWQPSKFELSWQGQRVLSTGTGLNNCSVSFKDYNSTGITWGTVASTMQAAPTWTTATGSITLMGGRLYNVCLYITDATNFAFKNIILSGTSTDSTINAASPGLLFTTAVAGIGSLLSTAAT